MEHIVWKGADEDDSSSKFTDSVRDDDDDDDSDEDDDDEEEDADEELDSDQDGDEVILCLIIEQFPLRLHF